MKQKIKSYEDLIVWKKAMDLVIAVYELTNTYPKSEQYGLVSQMRRSTVSIPSNIAEGYRRGSRKDYRHFLIIAFGSASELETQLKISERLSFGNMELYKKANDLLNEVLPILNSIISKLKT